MNKFSPLSVFARRVATSTRAAAARLAKSPEPRRAAQGVPGLAARPSRLAASATAGRVPLETLNHTLLYAAPAATVRGTTLRDTAAEMLERGVHGVVGRLADVVAISRQDQHALGELIEAGALDDAASLIGQLKSKVDDGAMALGMQSATLGETHRHASDIREAIEVAIAEHASLAQAPLDQLLRDVDARRAASSRPEAVPPPARAAVGGPAATGLSALATAEVASFKEAVDQFLENAHAEWLAQFPPSGGRGNLGNVWRSLDHARATLDEMAEGAETSCSPDAREGMTACHQDALKALRGFEDMTESTIRESLGDLLDIGPRASADDVARARRQKLLEIHPDKTTALHPDLQAFFAAVAIDINAAWDNLQRQAGRMAS